MKQKLIHIVCLIKRRGVAGISITKVKNHAEIVNTFQVNVHANDLWVIQRKRGCTENITILMMKMETSSFS